MAGDARSDFLKKKIQAKIKGEAPATKKERSVELSLLKDNPYQPRMEYGEEELEALSRSIKDKGLLQPVVVTKKGEGYTIVAGHRRVRACRLAGLERIETVLLHDLSNKDLMLIAAAENIVRVNLTVIEEAKSYHDMIKNGVSAKQIAAALGVSETLISRKKNLLQLSDEILEDIRLNNSTKDVTALTLLRKVKDEKEQIRLYFEFLKKGREWLKDEVKNCACAIDKAEVNRGKLSISRKAKYIVGILSKKKIDPEMQERIDKKLSEIEEMIEKAVV